MGDELVAVIHTPAGERTHEPAPLGEVLDEQESVAAERWSRRSAPGEGAERRGITLRLVYMTLS